jgi:PASTA domain-containing protein
MLPRDMPSRRISTPRAALTVLMARRLVIGLASSAALLVTASRITAQAPAPITVGDLVAGSFSDATGHSAQSHLVYAVNSQVWWLFTLTSASDAEGGSNHIVKSFRSSGPDLATATWIPGADSPAAVAGSPNQFLGGGRSLGVAYLANGTVDVIHADISMAFDGQNGRTGHIRAVVTGTSIKWESWNFFDEPAATWTQPRGNTIGVSSGKFIHTGGPILQQEVDANARKSNNADTGSAWTSGFSAPAVIDGTMTNSANSLAFAPLANNVMLAIYDNGQGTEPSQTNLRYQRSNTNGTWPMIVVGSQLGGDGNVFGSTATINQNDWGIVSVSTSRILVFRRNGSGTGIDAASYNVAANTWSPMSPAPPLLAAGRSFKAGAGLFGATDGTNVWVFIINKDLPNSVLYTRFNGTGWSAWSAVPGTDIGMQNRSCISGSPRVGNNQIGLIWTEGTSVYDIVSTRLAVDGAVSRVTPTITWPTPAKMTFPTPLGPTQLNATASTSGTFVYTPSAGTVLNGGLRQLLSVTFTPSDTTRFTTASASVRIDVVNVVPNVVGRTQAAATSALDSAGLTVGGVSSASSATVPSGSVISQNPSSGTQVAAGSSVALVVSSGPAGGPAGVGAIGINFVGTSTTTMGASESAGVVPKPNWNNAAGAVRSTALALKDDKGTATTATVTWTSAGTGTIPISDQAGNARMMRGYLDTTDTSTTMVTVSGLTRRAYDVFVYADGDNGAFDRSATYTIIGTGITTTAVKLTDLSNTNFAGAFTRATNSSGNYVKFRITATGFTLKATPTAPATGTRRAPINGIQVVPVFSVGINFVGAATATMATGERAGVVGQPNWNNAAGATRSTPLTLINGIGRTTAATVKWTANGTLMTPIVDQAGNARMMKGYLDTTSTSVTTVTVAGLPSGAYDVYVYADGDNQGEARTGVYRIAGAGFTAVTVNLTDPANQNFSGTFTQASNTSGNYVKFRISGTAFTLTATPLAGPSATRRAPVNAIQIVAAN